MIPAPVDKEPSKLLDLFTVTHNIQSDNKKLKPKFSVHHKIGYNWEWVCTETINYTDEKDKVFKLFLAEAEATWFVYFQNLPSVISVLRQL